VADLTKTPVALPGLPVVTHPLAEMVKVDPMDRCCRCGAAPKVAFLVNLDQQHAILLCGHHAVEHAEKIRECMAWRYI